VLTFTYYSREGQPVFASNADDTSAIEYSVIKRYLSLLKQKLTLVSVPGSRLVTTSITPLPDVADKRMYEQKKLHHQRN